MANRFKRAMSVMKLHMANRGFSAYSLSSVSIYRKVLKGKVDKESRPKMKNGRCSDPPAQVLEAERLL